MSTDAPASRRRIIEWADPDAIAAAGRGRSGLDMLRAMGTGQVPPPPILALLGIEFVSADPGRVTMRMPAGEHLYNPIGSVHGGALATLLDSVMACAVHSLLEAGRAYTTLEIKVNYLRAVTAASGVLMGTGEVIHAGRRQAVAEGRIHDAQGRLCASGSSTCLIFDLPERRSSPEAGAGA